MALLSKHEHADGSLKVDELLGSVLNERYEVLRLLNEGGMAKIYLARHTVLGREVAIKVLKGGSADDSDAVQRFINEGRAAGTLGHPNIVECTDIGTLSDGRPYLVLELLFGHSLAEEIIRTGALVAGRAARIGLRIADALGAAHVAGIVHRDLKSDNVFLARKRGVNDIVKVLDFGVSKFSQEPVGTQKGSMLGTPDFMAPEQVVDAGAVDARADIYALGVILYEMLSGRRPFKGIAFPMVLYAIAHEPPPPLASFCPDAPAELIAVVEKAMAKRPEDRHGSMYELVAALEPFADRASLDSVPDDLSINSSVRMSLMPLLEAQSGAADEKRRSSSVGAAPTSATLPNVPPKQPISPARALGLVLVAAVMVAGIFVLTQRNSVHIVDVAKPPAAAPIPKQIPTAAVTISPPDAVVEVDGQAAKLANGVLTLQGPAGTVKHVRVSSGTAETLVDVVISLKGAMPSQIKLDVPAAASAAPSVLGASSAAPLRIAPKAPAAAPTLRDDR